METPPAPPPPTGPFPQEGAFARCYRCGREPLSRDEVGLNRKVVNRAVERFLCLSCLAQEFGESEEALIAFADRLRAQGCTLFPPVPDAPSPCAPR